MVRESHAPGKDSILCHRVGLSNLINLAIEDDRAILVEDGGTDVGVITRADLLRTVIEGTEVS